MLSVCLSVRVFNCVRLLRVCLIVCVAACVKLCVCVIVCVLNCVCMLRVLRVFGASFVFPRLMLPTFAVQERSACVKRSTFLALAGLQRETKLKKKDDLQRQPHEATWAAGVCLIVRVLNCVYA